MPVILFLAFMMSSCFTLQYFNAGWVADFLILIFIILLYSKVEKLFAQFKVVNNDEIKSVVVEAMNEVKTEAESSIIQ